MLNAQFFVGYTAGQLSWQIVGDETLNTSPLFWIGGERLGGFNICFDPTSSELYAWCEDLRAVTFALPSWVDTFLDDPAPGSKGFTMLGFFPALIQEEIEKLKDTLDEKITRYGEEFLEEYFGKKLLEEIFILEEYLQLATGELTLLV